MGEEITSALIRIFPFIVVIIIIALRIRFKKINPVDLNLNQPASISQFLAWTLGFLFFILVTEFIQYQLGVLETEKWNHPLISSVIRISGAVILAPIAEELIFRGLILNLLLKRKLNFHLSVFIQAVFFVLLHNFTYQNTLNSNIGILQSLADASLFAYARLYTRAIVTPMTMHMTGNLIATLERFLF